ncbi:unnamed protein product [Tetraodon nigroviridis]|uniref:(spotted green pufferfish) hypothetical protein n=1 Tax=Tetraodon nigroviridis TaxID=99883 RepID=Q4S2N8_TETNG|nr:unnamed protein product [Tetraodon nigroviridis]
MEDDDHERYISQLRLEFAGCDASASGSLGREELTALCHKLHLEAHLQPLLDTLLGQGHRGRVNFEEFKDGFVAVLSRSLDFSTSEDDSSYLEPVAPEEVRPKFVKGKKRYGRRSRPDKPGGALSQDPEDLGPSAMESSDLSPSGIRRAKLRRSTSLESIESLKSDVEPANQEKSEGQRLSSAHRRQRNALDAKCDVGVSVHCKCPQELLQKLDSDLDGGVSRWDFHPAQAVPDEHSGRSTTPSLLMATVGQRVLSRLDDGTGCCSPEQVVTLWTEEGIRSSREILQTLDFSLEDRLSLVDLTLALDNELLVSGNGIHQAALISYKNEIQHLQVLAEQACRERDKVKADLDQADQRNLQLVREVDDRHASMENLNQSRIRDLEQEFRDRLTAVRSQAEQESELLLQQAERERGSLQEELWLLRAQEAALQEELGAAAQENAGLEQELQLVKLQLTEAQNSVSRLQKDLDQLLNDKVSRMNANLTSAQQFAGCGLSLDERFSDLIKEYEQQCRELRDRNDELSSELELLQSQRSTRRWRRALGRDAAAVLDWTQPQLSATVCPLDDISGPTVSIQTEMALEQLKQKHDQELQQLRIQLETQLEISELEEQKLQAEQEASWTCSSFPRMQRERAEMEQNFAREIGNLVQRLSCEKEQLEAELKLQMDQEVSLLRQTSSLQVSQSEASLEALQVRCGRAEEELEAARARSSELEARLTEACAQLEESIVFLEEKSSVEEELGLLKRREEELLQQALEKTLEEERARNLELQEEREEVGHLRQEKQTYAGLADQLSAQIVEMEEEICTLRDHLREVSSQLDQTSNLVLHLRTQLNAKTAEADRLRTSSEKLLREVQQLSDQLKVKSGDLAGTTEQLLQLQEALVDSESHLRLAEDNFEQEKQRMTRQLVEMEALVLALEEAMDPAGPRRTRLEEVRSENITLQERLRAVQQEVHNMEEDAAKKSRNLQLSKDNAELSARFRGDQESVRLLQERLVTVSREQEEEGAAVSGHLFVYLFFSCEAGLTSCCRAVWRLPWPQVRRLQDAALQHEREKLQQHVAWTQEKQLMEQELSLHKEKVGRRVTPLVHVSALEAELSSMALKLQWSEDDKTRLQRETEEQSNKVDARRVPSQTGSTADAHWSCDLCLGQVAELHQSLLSLEADSELLRSQLNAVSREKVGHAQDVTDLQRKLQEAGKKGEELSTGNRKLTRENAELHHALEEQEEQISSLQEESLKLQQQNQQLQGQLSEVQVHSLEVQSLKTRLKELEVALSQTEEQAARADEVLSLVQVQQQRGEDGAKVEELQTRLLEEQRRSQQLEEALKVQAHQSSSQISVKQDQYEKALSGLQQRVQELDTKLRGVQMVLQEKVQQLKELLVKNTKSSSLVKELYVENAQLMTALQVTEQRQKSAEKKSFLLEGKVSALNKLLREVVHVALAT